MPGPTGCSAVTCSALTRPKSPRVSRSRSRPAPQSGFSTRPLASTRAPPRNLLQCARRRYGRRSRRRSSKLRGKEPRLAGVRTMDAGSDSQAPRGSEIAERREAMPTERPELIQSLGKWIALIASAIALVPPLTAAVTGYWQAEEAKRKGEQELALADLRERSALASEYLKLIIAKDTAYAERITLLDALSAIDKHPLQQWAKQRQAEYREAVARSEAALRKQEEAAQAKEGAAREEALILAEIEKLEADMKAD